MAAEEFVAPIEQCGICGGYHSAVTVKKLYKPRHIQGEILTYWAICPATGDPMFTLSPEENARRYLAGTLFDDKLKPSDRTGGGR